MSRYNAGCQPGTTPNERVKLRRRFVEAGTRVEIEAAEHRADRVGQHLPGIGDEDVAIAGEALETAGGGGVGREGGGAAIVDESHGVGQRFPE